MRKLLFALLLPLHCFSQDAALEKFIDSVVGPNNKPDVPGTIIMIAQDGKPLIKKAYGLASLEFSVPMRNDHFIAIGSVSKQFTAIGILKLVAEGKIRLDDDIRKYLPGINTWGQTITIDNLLSHTSGILSSERKDFTNYALTNGARVSDDAYVNYIMSEKLLFAPGTNWSYNNAGFHFLATIIEKVAHKPYHDYMKEQVFLPAGMMQTYIPTDLQILKDLPLSYTRTPDGKWKNDNVRRNMWQWSTGAGNVITTLDDMLQWDIALRENKLIPKELLEKAWTKYTLKNGMKVSYGYGFHVSDNEGMKIIHHTGAIYGYSTHSIHIPEKKLYVFYANYYGADPNGPSRRIIQRLLNIKPTPPTGKAEAPLTDYIGVYDIKHPGSRLASQISDRPVYVSFTVSGDSLFMKYTAREKVYMRPAGKDRFLPGRAEDNYFVFERDANGQVNSLQIRSSLFETVTADEKYKKLVLKPSPPPVIVSVKPEVLKPYAGTYYRGQGDMYFYIKFDGNKLYGYDVSAANKFELLPLSNTSFMRKGIEDNILSFQKDKDGLWRLTVSGNRNMEFRKVSDY
jgi:D-alanyl-D-alanine carboxypeptidase